MAGWLLVFSWNAYETCAQMGERWFCDFARIRNPRLSFFPASFGLRTVIAVAFCSHS